MQVFRFSSLFIKIILYKNTVDLGQFSSIDNDIINSYNPFYLMVNFMLVAFCIFILGRNMGALWWPILMGSLVQPRFP